MTDPAPPAALDADRIAETLQRILARHLGIDDEVEICETISGNINHIYKVKYAGRLFGVRISAHEHRFKYEKDIIKEVFAICLLNYVKDEFGDAIGQNIVDGIMLASTGSNLGHGFVRRVMYYDWSRQTIPFPFFIYEWVEGKVLWETWDEDPYFLAGRNLARLHRIRFRHYYQDIFKIGHVPLDWAENFKLSLAREISHAEERLPPDLLGKIKSLDFSGLSPGHAALVHNDYAGGNIVITASGAQKIIDWDNWVVESPELDLIKMKYWTAISGGRVLAHDADLYSAFLEGYRSVEGAQVDESLLHAYEYLWLLRSYNFECAKEADRGKPPAGKSWGEYYPPPAAYEDYLRDL